MIVELCRENEVLLRVDLWYLILSAILRSDDLNRMPLKWDETRLALYENTGDLAERVPVYYSIPQPPEFRGDALEKA